MMKATDEPAILSPPRIKRVAQCRHALHNDWNRSRSNFEVIESIFRGEDVPCYQEEVDVNTRERSLNDSSTTSGMVFPPLSVPPFPMTFERQRQQPQEVDEEARIGVGGCYYYNMDRKHSSSSTTIPSWSWEHKHATNTRARRNQCISSISEVCKKLYPFPFILMCAFLLFGIGEMLRRVGAIHGGRAI